MDVVDDRSWRRFFDGLEEARDAPHGGLPGVLLYLRGGEGLSELRWVTGDARGTVGMTLQELRQDPGLWREAIHEDDRPRVEEAVRSTPVGEEGSVDFRFVLPGGGTRWVRDVFVVRESAEGTEALGVLRDAGLERSLREQVSALESRIWKAQRVDSLGSLAAGIVHDFNNLLTTILGSAQLAEAEGVPDHVRPDLRLIQQAADRGRRMVNQILRFAARGESDVSGDVDLGLCVEELGPILERTLGRGVELRITTEPHLPTIRGNPAQLEQVLLNLVVNARDAMPDGGRVEVRVERERLARPLELEDGTVPTGAYVALRVEDTGEGIAEDARTRIFEPFFTTREREGGRSGGFGLSTVQKIARHHGGCVLVESVPGRGSTFTLLLPVRTAGAALPEMAEPPAIDVPSGLSVLLVQDDPGLREAMTEALVRQGHRTTGVANAADALRAFDSRPRPDAVVVDLVLSDRSGLALIQALRRRVPDLPVVLVTPDERSLPGVQEVVLPRSLAADELGEALVRALPGGAGGGERRDAGR